jgi:DNA (cytosine-5)-methyltransferase 1
MRERIYFVGIRKDIALLPYSFPPAIPMPEISNYIIDTSDSAILDTTNDTYSTFLKYLNNKYNLGKYSVDELLSEEYLVIDTRQSDLRLYR